MAFPVNDDDDERHRVSCFPVIADTARHHSKYTICRAEGQAGGQIEEEEPQ